MMETVPASFEIAALTGINSVRETSPEAANAVELIYAAFGARAALRAGLMMRKLKQEIEQTGIAPDFDLYAPLFEEYPQAVRLARYAMTCWLQSWYGVPVDTREVA
jgi:hypothetical protein